MTDTIDSHAIMILPPAESAIMSAGQVATTVAAQSAPDLRTTWAARAGPSSTAVSLGSIDSRSGNDPWVSRTT